MGTGQINESLLTLNTKIDDQTGSLSTIVAGQTRVISAVVALYLLEHEALGAHQYPGRFVVRQYLALHEVDEKNKGR